MKVSIVTNMDPVCGNAEYARDLAKELQQYFPVELVRGFGQETGNVVLVNWHEAVVPANGLQVRGLQQQGKKVIVILQNSWDTTDTPMGRDWSAPEAADAVVAHEEMESPFFKVRMIPHGIHVVDQLAEYHDNAIGTAGFLFGWKRPDLIPKVAKAVGVPVRMVHPKYVSGQIVLADPERFEILYREYAPMEIIKEYLPLADVARVLSKNLVNIFWFQTEGHWDELGQTGSARMGVSAQRPMIISRHRKFRSFAPYADEFYVADTEEQVTDFVREIKDDPNPRIPQRCLQDMSWEVVGQKYRDLIEEIA